MNSPRSLLGRTSSPAVFLGNSLGYHGNDNGPPLRSGRAQPSGQLRGNELEGPEDILEGKCIALTVVCDIVKPGTAGISSG